MAALNEGRAVELDQWARSKGLAVGVCTCSVPNRESTCYLYVDYTTMAVTLFSRMPPVRGVEFSWEEREAAYVALVIAG